MQKRFKRKSQRLLSLILAMLMMVCGSTMEVFAAENLEVCKEKVEVLDMVSLKTECDDINENIKAILYDCLISVNSSSNGMRVSFMTSCSQMTSLIGVKDIVIKQKVWYGWKTVATSSGGSFTNASTYMGSILYTNAIKGEEYRITCTHYANADEYIEVHGELDVIFTY